MIRAAVGMNLPPNDDRFEAGDPIPDAEKRLGKAGFRQWLADGLLVDDAAKAATPAGKDDPADDSEDGA